MAVQITVIFQAAVRGAGAGQARPACSRAGNSAQAPGIHAEPEVREAELLTRRRLEWEEGELLHGTCCTPCDLGLVGGHLCTQQLQSQQGREILALRREKKPGINVRCPCSEASGGAVII